MANSVNKKGIPLIEVVLTKYLEALHDYISKPNLGPLDDLIYYDKVLTTILESDKFNISEVEKELLLNKIIKFRENHSRLTSQRAKEKLYFYTNSAFIKLNGDKEEETYSYLNYKYEVHDVFKEAHKSEAKQIYIANQKIEEPKYNKPIYTFDGEGACEIDDGLSISFEDGIYHLGVHIADPTAYISEDSIINDEARKRTRSLYMEDGCIPMYPLNLSKDLMGLNEGKRTYSMSYYFDIDSRTGNIIKFDIKAEPIVITKNMTYDQFDYILRHGTYDKNIEETLILLNQVSSILKQVYNEDLIYHEFHNLRDSSVSRGIVESAMIYANYNVAKLFDEKELPFIYRCHVVDEEQIQELTDLQERLKLRQRTDQMVKDLEMIKNLFPRAYYTRINDGHYGLGIDYYSHVTSPLRRYADNVANRCIKKFVLNKYTEEDVKAYNEYIDMVTEEINQKRRSLDDYEIEIGKRKSINK
jgi:exoribonuclease II